jgi:hypothetical protein
LLLHRRISGVTPKGYTPAIDAGRCNMELQRECTMMQKAQMVQLKIICKKMH